MIDKGTWTGEQNIVDVHISITFTFNVQFPLFICCPICIYAQEHILFVVPRFFARTHYQFRTGGRIFR